MSTQIGSATISVNADLTPFEQALETLQQIIDSINVNVEISANTEAAQSAIEALASAAEGIEVNVQSEGIDNAVKSIQAVSTGFKAAAVSSGVFAASTAVAAGATKALATSVVLTSTAQQQYNSILAQTISNVTKLAEKQLLANVGLRKTEEGLLKMPNLLTVFKEGFKSATAGLSKFGQAIGNKLKNVDRAILKIPVLGKAVALLKLAFTNPLAAIAVLSAALLTFVNRAANAADAVLNLARQAELSISSVQSLSKIASDAGLGFGELQSALNRLVNEQQEALTGNERAIKSYADLGITLSDLRRLSPEQLLQRTAEALAANRNNATAAAASVQLLGRNSGRLREVLDEIASKTLPGINSELENTNRIVSTESILVLDAYQQQWQDWKDTVKAVTSEAAASVLTFSKAVIEFFRPIIAFANKIFPIFDGLKFLIETTSKLFKIIADSLLNVLDKIPAFQKSVAAARAELEKGDILFRAEWDRRAQEQLSREARAAAEEAAQAAAEEEIAAIEAAVQARRDGYREIISFEEQYLSVIENTLSRLERQPALLREALSAQQQQLRAAEAQLTAYEAIQEAIRNSLQLLSGAEALQRAFQQSALRDTREGTAGATPLSVLGQPFPPEIIQSAQEAVVKAEEQLNLSRESIEAQKQQVQEQRNTIRNLQDIKRELGKPILI
jgi:hypothetical protein